MDAYDFAEVCHARDTICEFCNRSGECSSCIVNRIVNDVRNNINERR